jgi:hypothetical protein
LVEQNTINNWLQAMNHGLDCFILLRKNISEWKNILSDVVGKSENLTLKAMKAAGVCRVPSGKIAAVRKMTSFTRHYLPFFCLAAAVKTGNQIKNATSLVSDNLVRIKLFVDLLYKIFRP